MYLPTFLPSTDLHKALTPALLRERNKLHILKRRSPRGRTEKFSASPNCWVLFRLGRPAQRRGWRPLLPDRGKGCETGPRPGDGGCGINYGRGQKRWDHGFAVEDLAALAQVGDGRGPGSLGRTAGPHRRSHALARHHAHHADAALGRPDGFVVAAVGDDNRGGRVGDRHARYPGERWLRVRLHVAAVAEPEARGRRDDARTRAPSRGGWAPAGPVPVTGPPAELGCFRGYHGIAGAVP